MTSPTVIARAIEAPLSASSQALELRPIVITIKATAGLFYGGHGLQISLAANFIDRNLAAAGGTS
jgi:hypothetical protein